MKINENNTRKNTITATPVKKYTSPKYPTQAESIRSPELLKKLPSRWQKNAAVIAAVGLLGTITLTSCGIFSSDINGTNSDADLLNVAPLFIHGGGTGSIGCVMIAPPVFLSEQEAVAIIKSEAETAGLEFTAKPPDYTSQNNKTHEESTWENEYVLGDGNIGLDLYDNEKNVAVTYISMNEAEEKYLPNKDGLTMGSSVTSYRAKELAGLTIEDFAKQQGNITIGVLYEPGIDWENDEYQKIIDEYYKVFDESGTSEKSWEEADTEYRNNIKALSEEELREQVRDFIEWLQGQGII